MKRVRSTMAPRLDKRRFCAEQNNRAIYKSYEEATLALRRLMKWRERKGDPPDERIHRIYQCNDCHGFHFKRYGAAAVKDCGEREALKKAHASVS